MGGWSSNTSTSQRGIKVLRYASSCFIQRMYRGNNDRGRDAMKENSEGPFGKHVTLKTSESRLPGSLSFARVRLEEAASQKKRPGQREGRERHLNATCDV